MEFKISRYPSARLVFATGTPPGLAALDVRRAAGMPESASPTEGIDMRGTVIEESLVRELAESIDVENDGCVCVRYEHERCGGVETVTVPAAQWTADPSERVALWIRGAVALRAARAAELAVRYAKEREEREEYVRTALEAGPTVLVRGEPGERRVHGRNSVGAAADKRLDGLYAEAAELAETENTLHRLEREQIAVARHDQIASWVAAHGSDSQRERLTAGLLPEHEVTAAMREDAFAAFASFPRYVGIDATDIPCHLDEDNPCNADVDFDVDPAKGLTDTEWTIFRALRAEVGGRGTVEARTHTGICESRGCAKPRDRTSRNGALVTINVGAFTFTREYSL